MPLGFIAWLNMDLEVRFQLVTFYAPLSCIFVPPLTGPLPGWQFVSEKPHVIKLHLIKKNYQDDT